MKRSGLKRTAPLSRGAPLPRTAPLQSGRTPLPKTSKKRDRANRDRAKVVKAKKAKQSWCSRCGRSCEPDELDAHELLSRGRGGSITDPNNIVLICRFPCHNWITTHPAEAEAEGWALKTTPKDLDDQEPAASEGNAHPNPAAPRDA